MKLRHVGVLEHFRSLAVVGETAEIDKDIVVVIVDTALAVEERLLVSPGVPLGVALVEEGNSDSSAAASAVGIAPDMRGRWDTAEPVDAAAVMGTQQAVVARV
ncbi:hypothetical protein H9Q72_012967 [Fusarium xylarioides]|uniref:Uncharacterized protein n=1 Tax=Fusarium xylarioides TaxID=221167 RepID=A0A9P7HGI8_9HYPO|nr:hypothetical protein H9Q72_012967 [Fusarium xylarioides]